jgi:hypothetical protein
MIFENELTIAGINLNAGIWPVSKTIRLLHDRFTGHLFNVTEMSGLGVDCRWFIVEMIFENEWIMYRINYKV